MPAHPVWVRFTMIGLAALFAGRIAIAQTQAAPVRIVTLGGFLGQLDGFCEQPGGTYDIGNDGLSSTASVCLPGGPGGHGSQRAGSRQKWPAALGGLLGAADWVKRQTATGRSLVLVTGNNQVADYSFGLQEPTSQRATAQDSIAARRSEQRQTTENRGQDFWKELRERLQPSVVGLGPTDFVRSLRIPTDEVSRLDATGRRALAFVNWIRENPLPLLASNAVVKIEGEKLNTITSGEYVLDIPADASIDWVQSLVVQHPRGAVMTAVLDESSAPFAAPDGNVRRVEATPKTAKDGEHTTITVDDGSLMPGMHYRLRITTGGKVDDLYFRTHQTLMPNTLATQPWIGRTEERRSADVARLKGFPVVLSPIAPGEDLLVVSLVASSTSLGLGKNAWQFQDPREVVAPGSKRPTSRIGFLSPADALTAILRRIAYTGAQPPFVVLLSALDDKTTQEIVETFPEIRMVVLPPASTSLGRASRATDVDEAQAVAHTFSARLRPDADTPAIYSGDLGFNSIVNRARPAATQMRTRPEWIGENGTILEAALSRNRYGEWEAHDAQIRTETIPGLALTYERRPSGLYYWPVGHQELAVGPYRPYFSTPVTGVTGNAGNFVTIWTNPAAFAAAAGQAVRTALQSDVAVIPEDLFDTDALGWLTHALSEGDTGWLSRFILERAMYRSYRFVRSDVQGDALIATLTKALADPLETGSGACIVGLGQQDCPASLNTKHPELLRVRDRAIVTSVFYNVALPDAAAEKLDLEHGDESADGEDSLAVLDEFLAGRRWESELAQSVSLKDVIETRASNEVRSYLKVPTLELGLSQTFVDEPPGRQGVLANLPVDFRGAKPERTLTGKLDADLALWEARTTAGRILANIDFSQRTEFKKDKPDEITFPRDSFFVGARIEGRWIPRQGSIEWRPYVGGFLEGPSRSTHLNLTATRTGDVQRDGFSAQESAAFATPLTFDPSQYLYAAVGVDVLPAAKDIMPSDSLSASITKLGADFGYGTLSNVLVGLDLGGEPQDLNRFLGEGPGGLLNEYFRSHATTFSRDVVWDAVTENRPQSRMRLTLEGELGWKPNKRTYKATIAVQYNRFNMRNAADLALSRNAKITSRFSIPLVWRLELVPAYEVQWAVINADTNNSFGAQRFELRANLPLFVRFGGGRFVQ